MDSRQPSPTSQVDSSAVGDVIQRNIRTLVSARNQDQAARGLQERVADQITAFSGSMLFLYVHAAWFGVWII
jgi:uncharacterized membrane protein